MQSYRHVQYGRWLWFLTVAATAIYVAFTPTAHEPVVYAVFVILVLAAAVFSRLEIRVDQSGVRWFFGWGFPGGSLSWGDVSKVETRVFAGMGALPIRWSFWYGWLWYSAGSHAVEFHRTHGSPITLGTDDPQGLCEAVERFRKGAA